MKEKSCGAVIWYGEKDERKYLIEKMRAGHFSLCKGHTEKGEGELETAKREIREETGLEPEIDTRFRAEIEYRPRPDVLKRVVFFLAESKTLDTVAQPEEVSRILWLDFDGALSALTHDSDRDVLKKAKAYLDTQLSTEAGKTPKGKI